MTAHPTTDEAQEPKRYSQTSGAMVESFNTFDGKPAGAWMKSDDYDALATRLAAAVVERDDARREAENYRKVAKLCTVGHEQAIQRAEQAESQWVPVSERLPDGEGHYLGWDAGHGSGTVSYEDGKWTDCFGYQDAPITHWMPLPPAPEAAGGGK